MLRILTMAGGLAGAVGFSQFPEFSQQYMQRLGGAVDELRDVVATYEADAAAQGETLTSYIAALAKEGPRAQTQAQNMTAQVARLGVLSDALQTLEGAGPFMRAKLATHMGDRGVASNAYAAFEPAVPASFEGAVFAGTGFVAGWAGLKLVFGVFITLWGLLLAPFARKKAG